MSCHPIKWSGRPDARLGWTRFGARDPSSFLTLRNSRLEGQGVLILVTTGRKSGKLRSVPLMYFQFEESGDLIIVASNYGQDHHPAWYLNISAGPNVSVETNGERFAAEARITQGGERTAVFDKVAAANSRFAAYRASADRQIPVVALRHV